MLYPDRVTVCVSSQAGCAMGCGFCATGQAGFTRHLTVGEIVEQVVARRPRGPFDGSPTRQRRVHGDGRAAGQRGERCGTAVERLHDDLGLSARKLTISTVGLVPGIRRLTERPLPVNLAVSLHAANDALRDELVPINQRYPIDELMEACADYLAVKGRRLSFEWAMIDGVNDRPSDAAELAELCRRFRLPAHVNLIPLNPTPGYPTVGSPLKRVHEFRDPLEALGVNATVRRNRGTDIDAACGQLAAGQPVTDRTRAEASRRREVLRDWRRPACRAPTARRASLTSSRRSSSAPDRIAADKLQRRRRLRALAAARRAPPAGLRRPPSSRSTIDNALIATRAWYCRRPSVDASTSRSQPLADRLDELRGGRRVVRGHQRPSSARNRSCSFSQTRRPIAASSWLRATPVRCALACMMHMIPHFSVPSTSHHRTTSAIDAHGLPPPRMRRTAAA